MRDLFGREKPGRLPRPLTDGEGRSMYQVGDIGHWPPSHDVAIFYADDGQRIPSPGIMIIRRLESALEVVANGGDVFELTIDTFH